MCKAECPFKTNNGHQGGGCKSHQHLTLPTRPVETSVGQAQQAGGCARAELIAAAARAMPPLPSLSSLGPSSSQQ